MNGKKKKKTYNPKPILAKFDNSKDEDKTLKTFREKKEVTYERLELKLASDFLTVTLEARSEWSNAFWN